MSIRSLPTILENNVELSASKLFDYYKYLLSPTRPYLATFVAISTSNADIEDD
jgi:hypothetical protein